MRRAIESVVDMLPVVVAGVMFWVAYLREWQVREMVLFGVLWIVSTVNVEADRIQRTEDR